MVTPGTPSNRSVGAIALQLITFGLAILAAAWGVFCAYGAAFPGPCGDAGGVGLGVIVSWVTCLPIGLASLAVGFFVRKGAPVLRAMCVGAALAILALEAVATYFLESRHCP